MTVQLACAFLDFLCLTVTLNLGTCNQDLRTSITDVHTLVAVCGCGMEWNCSTGNPLVKTLNLKFTSISLKSFNCSSSLSKIDMMGCLILARNVQHV